MELKIVDRLISRCTSWSELYRELSSNKDLTQKFKGDVFERLTQAYLLTMPEYSTSLANVWLNDEVPQNILRKLNLPSKDFGVDLIAKTNTNEFWTIQCKFKSTQNALTYKELSTFSSLSFVTAKNIRLALIAHSSNKPIRNRKFLGNISEIGLGRWLDLNQEEWSNIRNFCTNKPVKLVKRKPRPHQRKAINLSKKYFAKERRSRGKLIMPCATGKSLTAFWIAKSLEVNKTIVAVPSLSLIKQSLNDWTKEYLALGITPEWLCICSDESAGKVDVDEFDTDTYDLGIPTTTSKEEIKKFLGRKTKNPKIIFTTYQSSPLLASASKEVKANFDIAILDEAHKTVGIKDKAFSTLLFDEKIKIRKRLFMTATERVFRGSKDEVVSMDDPKIYGDDVYVMTFKDAIDQNIISDYKILTMAISDTEVDKLVQKNSYVTQDDDNNEDIAQYLASGIALKKAFKKHKINHAISFHRSIKLAKQFQEQQDRLNELKSLGPSTQNLHISSKKSSGERLELIKEFTECERSLLTNARCLTEGVDVPSIDCVMFVDSKQSVIDIVQASGRALRKFDGKDYGYILLPIVVPEDADLETFSETTSFRKITSIIAALSSQDERIAEEFKIENSKKLSSGKIINIETNLKLASKINLSDFSEAINLKTWEKVSKLHYRSFTEAREYARSLNLKTDRDWREATKSKDFPLDIPVSPGASYRNSGWISTGDWLGTGRVATHLREYRPFNEARKYARDLKLNSWKDWIKHSKSKDFPKDIRRNAYNYKEFESVGDWLGTGVVADKKKVFKSFKDARRFVRNLNLRSGREWNEYIKSGELPEDIPKAPKSKYKEFISMGDWIGSDYVHHSKRKYAPFKKARSYARSLKLRSGREWRDFAKLKGLPKDIPLHPSNAYKDKGYISMGDWLGTGRVADHLREYRPFEEARKYVWTLNLRSWKEWKEFSRAKGFPADIPLNPYNTYKGKGWVHMGDWLGTGRVPDQYKEYRPFKEARKYARATKCKNREEWIKHSTKIDFPVDIPQNAKRTYKDKGWKGWKDFLGN